MPLYCKFEEKQEHLTCFVSGEYTIDEAVWVFQLIVERCATKGLNHAFVDVTGIEHHEMATAKLITAHNIAELAYTLSKMGRPIPRMALYGNYPFIEYYKEISDYLQNQALPLRAFDDLPAAKEWLFASDS